jgi:hypothetical protein
MVRISKVKKVRISKVKKVRISKRERKGSKGGVKRKEMRKRGGEVKGEKG